MQIIPKHIIVQAGGVGSRMKEKTVNKPKCLLPVDGQPLLYHLFSRFPDSNFLIICDYKKEVLETYLKYNPPNVKYKLIPTLHKGTLAGMRDAIAYTSSDFLIIWCDLYFKKSPKLKAYKSTVYLTNEFSCRWSKKNNKLCETNSSEKGVLGLFYFTSMKEVDDIPTEGEFVKWLSKSNKKLSYTIIENAYEFRDLMSWNIWHNTSNTTRFFNKIKIEDNKIIKTVVDPEYRHLIEREINWYRKADALNLRNVPQLIRVNPLTISKIDGAHAFDKPKTFINDKKVVPKLLEALETMHKKELSSRIRKETDTVYITKTQSRVKSVNKIIYGYNDEILKINDKLCRNLMSDKYFYLWNQISDYLYNSCENFSFIHGDPTLSNTIIDDQGNPWFIDPRGYFGKHLLHGDPRYDYAKLYYSVVGNYDSFNRKQFALKLDESITVEIKSNHLEKWEPEFYKYVDKKQIKLIHGLIWLSLSGYVKDDYDSILASFYKGLLLIEEALNE